MGMNNDVVIKVDNVKKYFKVYPDKGKTLKDKVLFHKRNRYEKREVLKGISFEVKRGEAIGLIGKNGCGKSTTLKLLTRILRPNEGTITIDGRVSSLIELGAGFHPDLTGRENIYINASIFGITAKEVDERLDDIIRFSELEEYIDNPVRTYSSGMYMRLAFSVAINVDADILLIDEILAVGDMNFQEKCFQKLQEIKRNGTTIVIVSHAQGQIEKICDRCIWIEDGLIRNEGDTIEVGKEYRLVMEAQRIERSQIEAQEIKKQYEKIGDQSSLSDEERQLLDNLSCNEICKQCGVGAHREGLGNVRFTSVVVNDGKPALDLAIGNVVTIWLKCKVLDGCKHRIKISIGVSREDGVYCFGTTTQQYPGDYFEIEDEREMSISFRNDFLRGRYAIDLFINDEKEVELDAVYSIVEFNVLNQDYNGMGVTKIDYEWHL